MSLRRLNVFVLGIAIGIGVLATPAWAHVQVEAQPGAPGAVDAVLKITAAGESTTAGVTKLEIVADPAIPADQVTLVNGPTGWKTSAGSQGGFVVEGPALPTGQDANVSVRVKQLPNAPQVVFKVLQSYADGKIDRWIGLTGPDGKEPDFPAPVVKLTAGAQSAISPKPANDTDEETPGPMPRTGSAERPLALAGGFLLMLGGVGISAGTGSRRRLRMG
jgi:hypothetical protein